MSDSKLVGRLSKCFVYVVTMVIIVVERCKLVHSDKLWDFVYLWVVLVHTSRGPTVHTSRGPTVHTSRGPSAH